MTANILPCPFDLQRIRAASSFLASNLEDSSIFLLEMARDNDRGKRPWSQGLGYGSQSPPPHRMRVAASPN
jgi:hypothetical protein